MAIAVPDLSRCAVLKCPFQIPDYTAKVKNYLKDQGFGTPTLGAVGDVSFQIIIFPNGETANEENEEDNDFLTVYLEVECKDNTNLMCTAELGFEGPNGITKYVAKLCDGHEIRTSLSVRAEFIRKESIEELGLVSDGTLRCCLHIKFVEVGRCSQVSLDEVPPEVSKLDSDFQVNLQNGNVGEGKVTLVDAAGEEHFADLHVLKARSPVFERMFNSDMSENRSNRVVLGDTSATVLKQFLRFLYTAHVNFGPDNVDTNFGPDHVELVKTGVLLAALGDKYEVTSLVDLCIQKVKEMLSPNNVACVLKLADDNGLKDLKQTCVKYATTNAAITRAMQESTDFENLGAKLLMELFVGVTGSGIKRKINDTLEFPAGSDWTRLSYVQLKRACDERFLEVDGERSELITRLQSAESFAD